MYSVSYPRVFTTLDKKEKVLTSDEVREMLVSSVFMNKIQLNQEEKENMENLYQIYMVDKQRNIFINKTVVAKNEEEAKFKAGVYDFLTIETMEFSDVTVIVKSLGGVVVEDEKK